ncbi:hypothetical protein M1563_04830 [Patescibacteria group bacterium]|nr:hypothetical protein [Patescibacteria group bacterium]MCL5409473.1 hypothetical protein [Patescibacteria group bacterium]
MVETDSVESVQYRTGETTGSSGSKADDKSQESKFVDPKEIVMVSMVAFESALSKVNRQIDSGEVIRPYQLSAFAQELLNVANGVMARVNSDWVHSGQMRRDMNGDK